MDASALFLRDVPEMRTTTTAVGAHNGDDDASVASTTQLTARSLHTVGSTFTLTAPHQAQQDARVPRLALNSGTGATGRFTPRSVARTAAAAAAASQHSGGRRSSASWSGDARGVVAGSVASTDPDTLGIRWRTPQRRRSHHANEDGTAAWFGAKHRPFAPVAASGDVPGTARSAASSVASSSTARAERQAATVRSLPSFGRQLARASLESTLRSYGGTAAPLQAQRRASLASLGTPTVSAPPAGVAPPPPPVRPPPRR